MAVAQLKPDLVISPAADFLRIVDSIGAHPIGTRKTKYAKHPSKSAGGAVIALASRTDIQKLTDLRGKYIAATLPTSVDGMLAVRMELAERGFDSRQFFRSVRYLGYSMPNVIESVLSGHFDAGVVPVCTLERIEAEDLIERGALRVISPKSDDDTVCAHTSELYPDLVAASFPGRIRNSRASQPVRSLLPNRRMLNSTGTARATFTASAPSKKRCRSAPGLICRK